eukprot:GHVL01024316.1.p1 GENE.GHVL01024316.1~~GHVL01024316.1.p1  ORF type:complete len:1298 (+),score=235.47 GHVL01024316.1:203-4096(+)
MTGDTHESLNNSEEISTSICTASSSSSLSAENRSLPPSPSLVARIGNSQSSQQSSNLSYHGSCMFGPSSSIQSDNSTSLERHLTNITIKEPSLVKTSGSFQESVNGLLFATQIESVNFKRSSVSDQSDCTYVQGRSNESSNKSGFGGMLDPDIASRTPIASEITERLNNLGQAHDDTLISRVERSRRHKELREQRGSVGVLFNFSSPSPTVSKNSSTSSVVSSLSKEGNTDAAGFRPIAERCDVIGEDDPNDILETTERLSRKSSHSDNESVRSSRELAAAGLVQRLLSQRRSSQSENLPMNQKKDQSTELQAFFNKLPDDLPGDDSPSQKSNDYLPTLSNQYEAEEFTPASYEILPFYHDETNIGLPICERPGSPEYGTRWLHARQEKLAELMNNHLTSDVLHDDCFASLNDNHVNEKIKKKALKLRKTPRACLSPNNVPEKKHVYLQRNYKCSKHNDCSHEMLIHEQNCVNTGLHNDRAYANISEPIHQHNFNRAHKEDRLCTDVHYVNGQINTSEPTMNAEHPPELIGNSCVHSYLKLGSPHNDEQNEESHKLAMDPNSRIGQQSELFRHEGVFAEKPLVPILKQKAHVTFKKSRDTCHGTSNHQAQIINGGISGRRNKSTSQNYTSKPKKFLEHTIPAHGNRRGSHGVIGQANINMSQSTTSIYRTPRTFQPPAPEQTRKQAYNSTLRESSREVSQRTTHVSNQRPAVHCTPAHRLTEVLPHAQTLQDAPYSTPGRRKRDVIERTDVLESYADVYSDTNQQHNKSVISNMTPEYTNRNAIYRQRHDEVNESILSPLQSKRNASRDKFEQPSRSGPQSSIHKQMGASHGPLGQQHRGMESRTTPSKSHRELSHDTTEHRNRVMPQQKTLLSDSDCHQTLGQKETSQPISPVYRDARDTSRQRRRGNQQLSALRTEDHSAETSAQRLGGISQQATPAQMYRDARDTQGQRQRGISQQTTGQTPRDVRDTPGQRNRGISNHATPAQTYKDVRDTPGRDRGISHQATPAQTYRDVRDTPRQRQRGTPHQATPAQRYGDVRDTPGQRHRGISHQATPEQTYRDVRDTPRQRQRGTPQKTTPGQTYRDGRYTPRQRLSGRSKSQQSSRDVVYDSSDQEHKAVTQETARAQTYKGVSHATKGLKKVEHCTTPCQKYKEAYDSTVGLEMLRRTPKNRHKNHSLVTPNQRHREMTNENKEVLSCQLIDVEPKMTCSTTKCGRGYSAQFLRRKALANEKNFQESEVYGHYGGTNFVDHPTSPDVSLVIDPRKCLDKESIYKNVMKREQQWKSETKSVGHAGGW